jgi:hypothetical protein
MITVGIHRIPNTQLSSTLILTQTSTTTQLTCIHSPASPHGKEQVLRRDTIQLSVEVPG